MASPIIDVMMYGIPKIYKLLFFLHVCHICVETYIYACVPPMFIYLPTYLPTCIHTYTSDSHVLGPRSSCHSKQKRKTRGSVKALDLQISIYPLVPSTPGLGGEFMGWLRSTTMEQQPQQFQHLGVGDYKTARRDRPTK